MEISVSHLSSWHPESPSVLLKWEREGERERGGELDKGGEEWLVNVAEIYLATIFARVFVCLIVCFYVSKIAV